MASRGLRFSALYDSCLRWLAATEDAPRRGRSQNMLIPGRYPKGQLPVPDKDLSISMQRLSLIQYAGLSASLLQPAERPIALPWSGAVELLRILMRGETLPPDVAEALSPEPGQTRLLAEYRIQPSPQQPHLYMVRYEVDLALESEAEAEAVHRDRQPFPAGERLTYVEHTGPAHAHRRKAFDTMALSPYAGIHPGDILFALAPRREQRAQLTALRLLAARLGRSLLFFDDFLPLAQQTAHLRPGAFFLRALRVWAGGVLR